MYSPEAQARIEGELFRAEAARNSGNEGQARVCARRAAGEAIREGLRRQALTLPGPSAVDLLNWVQSNPEMPEEIRKNAENLLMRVNPEYQLPVAVDLVKEARAIIAFFEG